MNSTNLREIFSRILIFFLSLALTLFVAEFALRFFRTPGYYDMHFQFPDEDFYDLVHQKSSTPGLPYELRPNVESKAFKNKAFSYQITTNSLGMRDLAEPTSVLNPATTTRIAVVGDSIAFGAGVNDGETFSAVMEKMLNSSTSGKKEEIEVLNLAVGGYSARNYLQVVKHKALPLKPQIIIISYCLNDPELDLTQPLHSFFRSRAWYEHLYLWKQYYRAQIRVKELFFGNGDYIRYLHRYPPSWDSVVTSFREISALTKEKNISVYLVVMPHIPVLGSKPYKYLDLHQQVCDATKTVGFSCFDLYPAFANYTPADLWISYNDGHPNALGHQIIAQQIVNQLTGSI